MRKVFLAGFGLSPSRVAKSRRTCIKKAVWKGAFDLWTRESSVVAAHVVNGRTIELVLGDITEQRVDAIAVLVGTRGVDPLGLGTH